MPIRGLTDRAQPTFPRVGKLRKGGPKGARRPGEDLNHWRFTSDNPAIVKVFTEQYGSEPREIDVLLPYVAIEDCFATWKEHWIAGGLQHRCDGERCTIWLTSEGKYSRQPKACPGGCKEIGRLALILPPLIRAGFVGYVTMETSSLNDILAILSTLLATKEQRGYEDMRGILFTLRRVEETISTPGTDGKRVRRKKWLVKLEPAAQWVQVQLEAAQRRAMLPMDIRTGEIVDSVARELPEEEPEPTITESREKEDPPPSRPYPPETVKAGVLSRASKGDPVIAPQGFRGLVVGYLEAVWVSEMPDVREANRHSVLNFLFGDPSSKKLTTAQGKAILAWLTDQQPDGKAVLNAHGVAEAHAIIRFWNEAAGQQRLEMSDEAKAEEEPPEDEDLEF